jgi:hypothetical protein
MAETNDWRLTGQERYLSGKTLHQVKWTSDQQNWDHEPLRFLLGKVYGRCAHQQHRCAACGLRH